MKKRSFHHDSRIFFTLVAVFFALCIVFFLAICLHRQPKVESFDDCIKLSSSRIQESYPEVCVTASGQRFVNPQQRVSPPDRQVSEQKEYWKTYQGERYLFQYPAEWQLHEYEGGNRIVVDQESSGALTLIFHLQSPMKKNASPSEIIDDYYQYYSSSTSQFSGTPIVREKKAVTVSGLPAVRYELEDAASSQKRVWIFITNGKEIVFFDEDPSLEIKEKILSTFQFKE